MLFKGWFYDFLLVLESGFYFCFKTITYVKCSNSSLAAEVDRVVVAVMSVQVIQRLPNNLHFMIESCFFTSILQEHFL